MSIIHSIKRLPIIGVMGSGTRPWTERAVPLGRWLAQTGVHLLTGGGGGVMETVSRGFHELSDRIGCVIGILPGGDIQAIYCYSSKSGYPNRWVEIAIRTHLPFSGQRGTDTLSRNHINVLSADVVVALPGGLGTSSEVSLCKHYHKPIIAWLDHPEQIPDLPASVPVVGTFAQVQRFVESELVNIRRPLEDTKSVME
jgi:uncharacterized protein (TIGR00725 family)